MNTSIISIIGLTFDTAVSAVFAIRLLFLKLNKNGLFAYFNYFFLLFSFFCLSTLLFVIFPTGGLLTQIFFLLSFGFLLLLSNVVLHLDFYIYPNRYKRVFEWLWLFASTLSFFYLVATTGSNFSLSSAFSHRQALLIIILVIVSIPFIAAAVTFLYRSVIEKELRQRYLYFGLAFLLIIIGGPLHQFKNYPTIYLLGDLLVATGFSFAFLALVKKQ